MKCYTVKKKRNYQLINLSFPTSVVRVLHPISLRDGAMASHTGSRASQILVSYHLIHCVIVLNCVILFKLLKTSGTKFLKIKVLHNLEEIVRVCNQRLVNTKVTQQGDHFETGMTSKSLVCHVLASHKIGNKSYKICHEVSQMRAIWTDRYPESGGLPLWNAENSRDLKIGEHFHSRTDEMRRRTRPKMFPGEILTKSVHPR